MPHNTTPDPRYVVLHSDTGEPTQRSPGPWRPRLLDLVRSDRTQRYYRIREIYGSRIIATWVEDPMELVADDLAWFDLVRSRSSSPTTVRTGDIVFSELHTKEFTVEISNGRVWLHEGEGIAARQFELDGEKDKIYSVRRPVRVGDHITIVDNNCNVTFRFRVDEISEKGTEPLVKCTDLHPRGHRRPVTLRLGDGGWHRWEHECGIPIDPRDPLRRRRRSVQVEPDRLVNWFDHGYDIKLDEAGDVAADFSKALTTPHAHAELTRALYATDPEVIAYLLERSEAKYEPERPTEEEGRLPAYMRALDKAFELRLPKGARERAELRAADVISALHGNPPITVLR